MFEEIKGLYKLIFILGDGCPIITGEYFGIFGYLKWICPLLIKIIYAFHSEHLALKSIYEPKKGI